MEPLFYKTLKKNTYPINAMSLSDAERSESYPIEKSYSKYSFQNGNKRSIRYAFKTIHNYRCVLS